MDDYDDYYYEDYVEDELDNAMFFCVLPVIEQVTAVFLKLFGLSAMVSILAHIQCDRLNSVMDILLGLVGAMLFYSTSTIYIVALVVLSYVVMWLSSTSGRSGTATLLVNLVFVFICELVTVEAEQWHQVRGTVILLLMKTTSVAFDVDAGAVSPPNMVLFSAYALSPVSLIFGPFVTLPDYRLSKLTPFTRKTFYSICSALSRAYASVVASTCILPYAVDSSSDTLLRAYFTAQSFRTSHYFVSYTSQVSALIGGLQQTEPYSVVLPLRVEIPRSMSSVAKAWNLPMHFWLKTYIYKKSRSCGVFVAAFLTYAASSILHGLNFQLPTVLFSIFVFSYVESALRGELATLLNSCVLVHKCTACSHCNKICEMLVKVLFVALNIVQLAYLGVMFDSSPTQTEGYSRWNIISKWNKLHWYGHALCLAGLVATHILRLVNRYVLKKEM